MCQGLKFIGGFHHNTGTVIYRIEVCEWIEKFKSGWTNVTHEEGAGRPSTSTTDEKIQQAREMVQANRRVAIDEVACCLQISHGSAYQIIHDKLNLCKQIGKRRVRKIF